MSKQSPLLSEPEIVERIFNHIDNKTTDLGDTVWKEPTASYLTEERFKAEVDLLRRLPLPIVFPSCFLTMVATLLEKLPAHHC